ncbi:MAG TPA: methylmalonyl Co-A mutase-associated GTPase MeaB [Rhodospirillales bacterium]|jgi:LAO/AO transport system kinase|nr:methylmalonyl Co-A mutase-associated GTPase MeaB [Rhodospirillales bacterium]
MNAKSSKKDTGLDMVGDALTGNVRAIARLISVAEAAKPESLEVMAEVFRNTGSAHVIGLTGVPGSGKSTLVRGLAEAIRAGGRKVGIVAIDPSSPFSGGAILGDRIRMTGLTGDDGVFIRSMATRGAMGGLARASLDAVDVLDAAGFDVVLIETVGVGQDEVDIVQAAHTVVVVSAPGLGDEIQAIKAGILEIADIHVVSKCDRADAAATVSDIKGMLSLGLVSPRDHGTDRDHDTPEEDQVPDQAGASGGVWRVSVVPTSAETDEGIEDLLAAINDHRQHLDDTGAITERRRQILEMRILKTAEYIIRKDFRDNRDKLVGLMDRVMDRTMAPHEAAEHLLKSFKKG